MRRSHFVLLALGLFLAAQPLIAATYYVGYCEKGAFSSIQAAVTAVPGGSTVEVCPGYYAEQVVIDKALTLEAIPGSLAGPVVIFDGGVSLVTTTSIYWGTVAPQIQVTAGPVNITNINVLQSNPSGCPATEIAIFYSSGSSGTVNGVETNGNCNFNSIGIAAENGAGATRSIKIENSQINAGSSAGISVGSNQTPSSLTAVVENNFLYANSSVAILALGNVEGSISNNSIASSPNWSTTGVAVWSGNVTVSENRIDQQYTGIDIEAPGVSVTSNQIFGTALGINIGAGNALVKGNTITYSLGDGIVFSCTTGNTVTKNVINNANIGLDWVPDGFIGSNTFYNVNTRISSGGGCS